MENAPPPVEVAHMSAALVDLFCRSFSAPPFAITLDIDDACDPIHGHRQLSLFNAHYDTLCFMPVHVNASMNRRMLTPILGGIQLAHSGVKNQPAI